MHPWLDVGHVDTNFSSFLRIFCDKILTVVSQNSLRRLMHICPKIPVHLNSSRLTGRLNGSMWAHNLWEMEFQWIRRWDITLKTYCLSLSLICHWFAWYSSNLWDSTSRLVSKRATSVFLCSPMSNVHVCFNHKKSSLNCAFSFNNQFSFLLQVDWRFRLSDRVCANWSRFPLHKVPSTLAIDSLPCTRFLVLDHMSALSHGFTTLAGTGCGLPLAAACWWKPSKFSVAATVVVRSLFSMLKLFLFEDLLIGVGSLLTSMQFLGITCERSWFSRMAKQQSSWRSSTKGSPDYRHWQWVRCRRRWCGTKWWKWVRRVEGWSMKHAVRVDDFQKGAQMCNTSQSCHELEPHACACENAVKCSRKMCVRRHVLSSWDTPKTSSSVFMTVLVLQSRKKLQI